MLSVLLIDVLMINIFIKGVLMMDVFFYVLMVYILLRNILTMDVILYICPDGVYPIKKYPDDGCPSILMSFHVDVSMVSCCYQTSVIFLR